MILGIATIVRMVIYMKEELDSGNIIDRVAVTGAHYEVTLIYVPV